MSCQSRNIYVSCPIMLYEKNITFHCILCLHFPRTQLSSGSAPLKERYMIRQNIFNNNISTKMMSEHKGIHREFMLCLERCRKSNIPDVFLVLMFRFLFYSIRQYFSFNLGILFIFSTLLQPKFLPDVASAGLGECMFHEKSEKYI